MRLLPTWFTFCWGLLCTAIEFRSIKSNLLFAGFIANVPFVILCILSIINLYKDVESYKETKKILSFLPFTLCFGFIVLISVHMFNKQEDTGKTILTISNDTKNPSHEINLYFKENGDLKMTQCFIGGDMDYFGSYKKVKDTFYIKLKNDLQIGKKGIVKNDTFYFIDDSTKFEILKSDD
jgi:hypothetical protein